MVAPCICYNLHVCSCLKACNITYMTSLYQNSVCLISTLMAIMLSRFIPCFYNQGCKISSMPHVCFIRCWTCSMTRGAARLMQIHSPFSVLIIINVTAIWMWLEFVMCNVAEVRRSVTKYANCPVAWQPWWGGIKHVAHCIKSQTCDFTFTLICPLQSSMI